MAEFSCYPQSGSTLLRYLEFRRSLPKFNFRSASAESLIAYQTAVLQNDIRNASVGAQISMRMVCQSIDKGFDLLSKQLKETNYKLGELNDSINCLYALLDERLDTLIYTIRETNDLLSNLIRISVIPDRQKDSYAYIERAITFFNVAIDEGVDSDIFINAYNNLNEALKLDDENFITHLYLGQIILNSSSFLAGNSGDKNLEFAEHHLKKAAKFAKILGLANRLDNQSVLFNSHQFGRKITNKEAFFFEASNALLLASKAAYLRLDFDTAIDYCKQAIELTPNWTEPLYRLAKALAAKKDNVEAAKIMNKAIELDRFQALKIIQDPDLHNSPEIQNLIKNLNEKLRDQILPFYTENADKLQQLKLEIKNIQQNFSTPLVVKINIDATDKNLNKVKTCLKANDYISLIQGLDIVKKINDLTYSKGELCSCGDINCRRTTMVSHKVSLSEYLALETQSLKFQLDNFTKEKKRIEKEQLATKRLIKTIIVVGILIVFAVFTWYLFNKQS